MKIQARLWFLLGAIATALTLFLISCGGGSSDSPATSSLTITAVDPYITDAQFFVDLNGDGVYDSGDKLSSAGSSAGQYVFSDYIPSGDVKIYAKSNGKHNGVAFNLGLEAKVASGSTTAVLNPATTAVNSLGLTALELVQILNQFHTTIGKQLVESDILSDPVKGILNQEITTVSDISDEALARIRVQIILTGLLRMIKGSNEMKALTKAQFIASATIADTDTVSDHIIYKIINAMVTSVSSGLNKTQIAGILNDSNYSTFASQGVIPKVQFNQLIKAGVTIMDRIVDAGVAACNAYNTNIQNTGGTWSATDNMTAVSNAIAPLTNVTQLNAWSSQLGPRYYAADFYSQLSTQARNYMSADPNLNAGMQCAQQSKYYIQISPSDNSLVCVN